MKKLVITLSALIVTLALSLVFASSTGRADVHTAQAVCWLPSVENGYPETTPVRCVNTGAIATQADIQAGVYAPPLADSPATYQFWYSTDAVLIHHGRPCYVVRFMGASYCAGTHQEPTQGQYSDWHEYQTWLGGPCVYIEPDQPACDDI